MKHGTNNHKGIINLCEVQKPHANKQRLMQPVEHQGSCDTTHVSELVAVET